MCNMTYEQFEFWCKHWNMTIEEGYKAMCFTSNIIGQNLSNHYDYANQIANDDNHTYAFKKLVGTIKDDAILLSNFYGNLKSMVFDMLKKHDEENELK